MVRRKRKTRIGKKGRYKKKKKTKVGGIPIPGSSGNGAVIRVYRHFSSKLSKLV